MQPKRDPQTSYRVEVTWPVDTDLLTFHVTIYPPANSEKSVSVGSVYREDSIPEWMQIAVDMLDMAAVDGNALIPFFGSKAGNVYWFHAQQVYYAANETKT